MKLKLILFMMHLKYNFFKFLCRLNLHPKKVFSHRFNHLYSVYEVNICKVCLKQLIKKK